jgi:hypothetical protein
MSLVKIERPGRVPWTPGTTCHGPAEPAAPRVTTRAQRCARKAAQIAEDITSLERALAVASVDDIRRLLEGQIAFQRRRLAWLDDAVSRPLNELRLVRDELAAAAGETGRVVLEQGLWLQVPAELLDIIARLAIVNFVLRGVARADV